MPVLGVEPAENIARVAEDAGIRTRCRFFGEKEAHEIVGHHGKADVFHANNVLAHVADQNDFAKGVKRLLKPDGVAIFEFPYVGDMISSTEFDTIYHEHLCYFSLESVRELMLRNGLSVYHVERLPVHGGSLRIFVKHSDAPHLLADISVSELSEEERIRGMWELPYYMDFAARVNMLGMQLWQTLYGIKMTGAKIAGYGASAKGSTLLNYFGIGANVLEFIVDRSPHKQGKFSPAFNLPILPPQKLMERQIPYALLLTWNFAREILDQNTEWSRKGGLWIVPLPHLIVTGGALPNP